VTTESVGWGKRGTWVFLGLAWLGVMTWQFRQAVTPPLSVFSGLPSEPRDLIYSVFAREEPAGTLYYFYTPDPSSEEALVAFRGEVRVEGISHRLELSAKLSGRGELKAFTFILKAPRPGFPLTGILDRGILNLNSPVRGSALALPLPSGTGRLFLLPLSPLEGVKVRELPLDLGGLAPGAALLFDSLGVPSGVILPGGWRVIRREPGFGGENEASHPNRIA